MTSSKPYLIRALYEWIVDNNMTPQILVESDGKSGYLPQAYVKDGRIVLNIAPQAVRGLELGDIDITFSARFGGTPMNVLAPISQVLAIYARENGQGMLFSESTEGSPPEPPESDPGPASGNDEGGGEPPPPKPGKRPSLKLVK